MCVNLNQNLRGRSVGVGLLGACLFLLGPMVHAQVPGPQKPDMRVLAVGIDRYPSPLSSLQGCVNDALDIGRVFRSQEGGLYTSVSVRTLTDGEATREKILTGLEGLRGVGRPGDWYVVLLSGHGNASKHRWTFATVDRGEVSDTVLLEWADDLARRGGNVVLLIDACFSGQLLYSANNVLNRHVRDGAGGILIGVSSMPSQTSAALQTYSAFAHAVVDGLEGLADRDVNQVVTVKELRRYVYNRVYELALEKRSVPGLTVSPQDCAIDVSPSLAESTPLVQVKNSSPPKIDAEEPLVSRPEFLGYWVGTTTDSKSDKQGAPKSFRLKLSSDGVYRITLNGGGQPGRNAEGMYKTTAHELLFRHQQGVDRVSIQSVTDGTITLRFGSRDLVLRRETFTTGGVAGSSWSGSETLQGFGSLRFEFDPDGAAIS